MSIIARPTPVSKPRTTKGRYASPASPWGITEVLTPHYKLAYQVGPNGLIFADKAAAERFATARQTRRVAFN